MDLQPIKQLSLETERYHLRALRHADVSRAWMNGMRDEKLARSLNLKPRRYSASELARYIDSYANNQKALLGYFNRTSGIHYGVLSAIASDSGRNVLVSMTAVGSQFDSLAKFLQLRSLTFQVFDALFQDSQCKALVASVLETNVLMFRMLKQLGWKVVRTQISQTRNGSAVKVHLMVWDRADYDKKFSHLPRQPSQLPPIVDVAN